MTVAILASGHAAAIEAEEALLTGRLADSRGLPLEGFRVVARVIDTAVVFVSPPSDDQGVYSVELPSGETYVLVAVVTPDGNRIPLAEEAFVDIGEAVVTRNLSVDMELVRSPRRNLPRGQDGLGRMFLQLVEDPDVVRHLYFEVGVGAMDYDTFDRLELSDLAAFRPVPRVELGLRGRWAKIDGKGLDESGIGDTDLWAKFNFYAAPTGRASLAAGALATLPTADADLGLGHDAVQSKLFVSGSWASSDFVVVGHAGARATEDGKVGVRRLEGTTSATAGLGVLVPLSDRLFVAFEAAYEGERFEQLEPDSRALAGVSWRPPLSRAIPGVFRGAVSFGLDDGAPDSAITVGWATGF